MQQLLSQHFFLEGVPLVHARSKRNHVQGNMHEVDADVDQCGHSGARTSSAKETR